MRRSLSTLVLPAAFGLGLCLLAAPAARAQNYRNCPQGPVYVQPGYPCPAPPYPLPVPSAEQHPSDLPKEPSETPAPGAAAENQPAAPEAAAAPSAEAPAAAAGPGAESSVAMLGRGDADNRFNLFDNNSAFPTNRVWFSYELMQGFQTGVRIGIPTSIESAAQQAKFGIRHTEDLYREGAEIALSSRCSIAFQDQYIATEGDSHAPDAWGDPEIMLKYAFCETATSAVAATLGLQPQVASNNGELHEKDTRFFPGVLFFQGCGKMFVQGGAQFGISSTNLANTFDWALATGCWIYRAETTEGHKPCLTGISPMIEIYGKHVLDNSQNQPFSIPVSSSMPSVGAPFREERNVLDVTAGGRILLYDHTVFGAAVSFPVTGTDVRRTEFLANLTFLF
jgi:hypothetical protein